MNVTKSVEKITLFRGIKYRFTRFYQLDPVGLIDRDLGGRVQITSFSTATLWAFLCGRDCIQGLYAYAIDSLSR